MKTIAVKIIFIIMCLMPSIVLNAASLQQIEDEISGISPSPLNIPTRDPDDQLIVMGAIITTGVLLVPESTNDRVMAFDPINGDLLDADFIPSDPANLATPIHAILAADNNSILISDQINDVVQQYDLNGNYLGVFAPSGGLDNNILDNIRGMELDNAGNLLVSVANGANADSIAQFDISGNYLGNFIVNAAGGLDSPFGVIFSSNTEFLVTAITSDAIHRYDNTGNYIADLTSIDDFPEQLYEIATGNLLVANFSGTQEGIVEFTSTGTLVGTYDPVVLGGYRGVYELANGNILTTNGTGVHEIDRLGNLVETKITGVSARLIEFVRPVQPLGEPQVVSSLSIVSITFLMLAFFSVIYSKGILQKQAISK